MAEPEAMPQFLALDHGCGSGSKAGLSFEGTTKQRKSEGTTKHAINSAVAPTSGGWKTRYERRQEFGKLDSRYIVHRHLGEMHIATGHVDAADQCV